MRTSRIVLAALLVGAFPVAAAEAPGAPLVLESLAPGVWAALQPAAKRFDDSNSLIVVGQPGVLVVDTQSDADAVRWLIAEIRRVTDKPVRYVINTHWHGDHTQGNALYREAFGDAVVFVGHETLAEDVPGRAVPAWRERVERFEKMVPEAEAQLARGLSLGGRELTPEEQARQGEAIAETRAWIDANRGAAFLIPDLDYSERMTLRLGEREIHLMHFRGHTRGDTVVWLPREKLLASGDLLDDLPYVGHGYPTPWIAALETLRGLPFERVVPGHGPVFTGPGRLDVELRFLRDLVEQVRQAVRRGASLEETTGSVDLTAHRQTPAGDDDAARQRGSEILGPALVKGTDRGRPPCPPVATNGEASRAQAPKKAGFPRYRSWHGS